MQVTCGAEWPTSAGGRQQYAISLDKEDLIEMIGEEKAAGLTGQRLREALTKLADSMVIQYVHKAGGMSDEMAQQRLRAIKNG